MSKIWIPFATGIVGLLAAWIKRSGGEQQLKDRLAKEEIVEDALEKRIILKADDVRKWFRRWQHTADMKTQKKFFRYVVNKWKEYDALRSRLGTS